MVNLCKNFMLFWQVYPKIQHDPLTIATGVYMIAGRHHYGNFSKIFLFCEYTSPLLILSTVLGQYVDFYRNWPWSGGIHLKRGYQT